MGLTISSIKKWFEKRQRRILMVGFPNAGKTTILNRLLLADIKTTSATPGFKVETAENDNFYFTVLNFQCAGGMESIYRKFFVNVEGIIFVLDSNDRTEICQAVFLLHKMLQDEKLKGTVLLVYANKQDLPNAMKVTDVIEELKLGRITDHRWGIIPTIAKRGYGLFEGLEWLANEMS